MSEVVTSDRPTGASVGDGIVTPEAVVLDVETAGVASRVVAGLIDLAIVVVGVAVVGSMLAGAAGGIWGPSTGATVLAFVVFGALFGYPILFETFMRGRTPGKAALRLRAVTVEGAPVRLREATLRAMGGVVDKLLPPGGITGALFVLLTPRHQRVGDLIAGTIVIRDPERHLVSPALWFTAPPGTEPYAETIDPTSITVEQYTVVRAFLTRGAQLAPDIRYALAIDLADRLAASIGHTRHPDLHPEVFLICAMARYQRRNGPGQAAGPVPVGYRSYTPVPWS